MRPVPKPNVTPLAKPNVTVVSVTPETAARWLEDYNHGNRHIRSSLTSAYTRDMVEGRWQLAGEPIKFAPDGRLLDGQHRLSAIVESGCTVLLFVARNIDPAAQHVMDTGAKRSAADALALDGGHNVVVTAAAARLALSVDAAKETNTPSSIDRYTATNSEVLAFVDDNPSLRESSIFASRNARRTDVPPAMVAYTHWRFRTINAEQADQFWIAAAEKIGLSSGDPVIALTNRFAEARRNREKLSRSIQMSLIFRAWNTRRAHSTMRFIRVNSPAGGVVPIPEPK